MTVQEFAEGRKSDWLELEEILERAAKKSRMLSRDDLDRFGRLYMRSTSDLAFARANYGSHEVTDYLNQLIGKAYCQIYTCAPSKSRDIIGFYRRELPLTFQRNIRFILIAFLIFAFSALAGYIIMKTDRETAYSIVPEALLDKISKQDGVPGAHFEDSLKPILSSTIMTNNIQVAFLSFSTGIFLGLGTIWILIQNGLIIGILACVFHGSGQAIPFWALILPHGVLELTAIFMASGAGLMLGYSLVAPGDYSRKDSLILSGKQAIRLLMGVIPILVLAGIIEAFITPLALPPVLKLAFAAFTGIGLFSWLLRPVKIMERKRRPL